MRKQQVYRYGEWAELHFQIGNRSGSEWMVCCPVHGDSNPSLQLNVESGLWICFVCREGGRIEKLADFVGHPLKEAEIDVQNILDRINLLSQDDDEDEVKVWPESWLTRYDFPTDYWSEERGFSEKTIRAFQLGYDPIGDDINGEFASIPVRNMHGDLLGIIKRYLGEDVEKNERYRYTKGFKKANHLFGAWLLDRHPTDTVVVVEGSTDCINIWNAGIPAVGTLGNAISLEQIRILRRLGIREVVLMFDNDKGGREATDTARGWKKHIRRVEVNGKMVKRTVSEYDPRFDLRREFMCKKVIYRPQHPKDPGGMSSMQIKKAVAKAKPLL